MNFLKKIFDYINSTMPDHEYSLKNVSNIVEKIKQNFKHKEEEPIKNQKMKNPPKSIILYEFELNLSKGTLGDLCILGGIHSGEIKDLMFSPESLMMPNVFMDDDAANEVVYKTINNIYDSIDQLVDMGYNKDKCWALYPSENMLCKARVRFTKERLLNFLESIKEVNNWESEQLLKTQLIVLEEEAPEILEIYYKTNEKIKVQSNVLKEFIRDFEKIEINKDKK